MSDLTIPAEVASDQAAFEAWRTANEVPKAPEPAAEEVKEAAPEPQGAEGEPEQPEADAKEEPEAAEGDKPKKKGGFQRKLEAKDAALLAAHQRIAELEAKMPKQEQPAGPPPEPEWDYSVSDVENQARIRAHAKELAAWELKENARVEAEQRQAVEAQARFQSSLDETAKKYNDFHDKLKASSDIPVSNDMCEFLLNEAENQGELAYWLASHPVEAAEIATMAPKKALAALARLDAKLGSDAERSAPNPAPKTSSPASGTPLPAPIRPIKASAAIVDKVSSEMSQAEYEAWRARTGRKS